MMESVEKLREAFEKCTYPIKDEMIELDTVWIPKAIAMMMLDDIEEEIVRCRDCCFSLAHGNGCGRNQDIYDAEPNGFCAWGKRKEGGDD